MPGVEWEQGHGEEPCGLSAGCTVESDDRVDAGGEREGGVEDAYIKYMLIYFYIRLKYKYICFFLPE